MMTLRVLILALFASMSLNAQDYEYRVMINSGDNLVMKAGTTEWISLKMGVEIDFGDKIKVIKAGYLVLINSNGTHKEMKDPGEFEIVQTAINEKAITGKYLDYVVSKMSPEEQDINRKNYASVTGATERGINDIIIYMQSTSPVFNSEIILRWTSIGEGVIYKISMKNMFDEMIGEFETGDNYLKVDLGEDTFNQFKLISVQITADEKLKSQKYGIQKIEEGELGVYNDEHNELKASLQDDSPMSELIMAEFYEQHKLLLDASTSYEKAMAYSPNIEYFQQAYREYLMRNGWSDKIN